MRKLLFSAITALILLSGCVNRDELRDVNIDKNGICIDDLREKLKLNPKFLYIMPNFHNPAGIIYSQQRRTELLQLMQEYNVPIYDVSRGMVNIMAGIEEICIWANFSEDVNGDIYCEFRSNGKNINVVATKYGGGGHLQASGTTVYSFDTVKEIINDLERVARGEECL